MKDFLRLFQRSGPKVKVNTSKKDGFSGWLKCTDCNEMIHASELKENLQCCPKCDHHYRLSLKERIDLLADQNTFKELFLDLKPVDALNFIDQESYKVRILKAQEKTSRDDAIACGTCKIGGLEVCLGVMDFSFMGGSMGSVVGEKITRLIEHAILEGLNLVIVSASGGARMQESILSLMQMAKTSAALSRLSQARLAFISILTNPTTGGVTASFASLGDIMIAEPKALIGFAGPRVIEQTIRQKLPEDAQKSEFLLKKGMLDLVVRRKEMKAKLVFFLEFFMGKDAKSPTSENKLEVLSVV